MRSSVSRLAVAMVTAASVAASACNTTPSAPASGSGAAPESAAAPAIEPGVQLSALAPANIAKPRPKAPFDLTGNWFIDTSESAEAWRFGPPYPKLTAAAQVHFEASQKAAKEGKVYRDDIGQCWPAGLPLIMTRYRPMAMVQIPTAIYMVSGFMNSFRIVYLDGRPHTELDIIARSFNGDSIRSEQRRSVSGPITTGWIRVAPPFQPASSWTSSSAFVSSMTASRSRSNTR